MSGQKHSFQLNDFLDHILEAINRIEDYTSSLSYAEFCRSTRDQDAVIRNFEIIGEVSSNIAQNFPELVAAHPELPIRYASHGYFGVDLEIVLNTPNSAIQYNIMLPPGTVLSCQSVHWNPACEAQRAEQHHPRRRRARMLRKDNCRVTVLRPQPRLQ